MTSNEPRRPEDAAYDETMIRPVESSPNLSKDNPYAPPADPYAGIDPYPAPSNPYGAPAADPYAQPSNPYEAPPAYPAQQLPSYPAPSYPTPGYPAPGYPVAGYPGGYNPIQSAGTNGLAIGALICGIASIVLFLACGLGIVLGIAGLVMGFVGMNQTKASGQDGNGMALAGVITGGIGTALSVGFIILALVA